MKHILTKRPSQLMKIYRLIVLFTFVLIAVQSKVHAQNPAFPIEISVQVMSPVPPYLPLLEQEFMGGQGSIDNRITGIIKNNSNTTQNIKLYAVLERMAPSPISIGLSASYQVQIPITLFPQQVLPITQNLINQAFGGFHEGSLEFQGTSLNALRNNGANYKIPEGQYRICLTAYDFNVPGKAQPLSLMNSGCGVFRICYSASAPTFVTPVTSNMGMEFQDYTPHSSKIMFTWIPPISSCGAMMPNFNYNLEIIELFDGQALNDALQNPPLFQDGNIHNTTYFFDTLLYPNVFKNNHKYVVRVKANILNPQSYLDVQNNGYSELCSFNYVLPKVVEEPKKDEVPGDSPVNLEMVANECGDVVISTNTLFAGTITKDQVIQVGEFKMHLDSIRKADNNTYGGKGYIEWQPYGVPLRLAVKFEKVEINTNLQLTKGFVHTVMDQNFQELENIDKTFNDVISSASKLTINNVRSRVNAAGNQLNKIVSDLTQLKFPLGLDNQEFGGLVDGTLAITNIVFSSKGSNMHVLLAVERAETLDDVIVLGGSNFCIYPDKVSMDNGVVYLAKEKKFSLDGNDFIFRSPASGVYTTNSIDTAQATYATWNSEGKFEEVVVNAQIFVSREYIVPLDSLDIRESGKKVEFLTTFKFKEWENWIAELKIDHAFEITALDGFKIKVENGVFYDHSKANNSPNFTLPKGYVLNSLNEFTGLYIHKLTLSVPNKFTQDSSKSTPVKFNNLIIDNAGVSATVEALNVLSFEAGELGGWGFSIDTLNVSILKNNPTNSMKMTGGIKTPISEQPLSYFCNLNTNENAEIDYQFSVRPKEDIQFNAWKAYLKLSNESNFSIVSFGSKTSIQASLHGSMGIDIASTDVTVGKIIPTISFPALVFQDMVIANAEKIYVSQLDALKDQASQIEEDLFFALKSLKFGSKELIIDEENKIVDTTSTERPKIAGFDISINKSKFDYKVRGKKQINVSLALDVSMDVGFDEAFAIAGKVEGLKMSGSLYANKAPTFDSVQIGKVSLNGEFGPINVNGSLEFLANDAQLGEGIRGDLKVDFPPGVSVYADGILGSKMIDNKKVEYFGFGASIYVEKGFAPIGPLVINGFGGGFYNNLEVKMPSLAQMETTDKNAKSKATSMEVKKGAITLKANVSFSLINITVLKADVDLLGTINNGALSKLSLIGNADLISDGKRQSEGAAKFKVDLKYAVQENIFDGYMSANAKLIGTQEVDIPIWMHVAPKTSENLSPSDPKSEQVDDYDYWLYIGHPGTDGGGVNKSEHLYKRITLQLIEINENEGKFFVDVNANAYFCIGSMLPNIPNLPDNVAKNMGRNGAENSLLNMLTSSMKGNKPGFMFGTHSEGKINLELGMFYAKMEANLGYDVALMRFNNPGSCAQKDGSFGMENWYAMGQMYAYLGMNVGFKVNVWFYEGQVSLAEIKTTALLEAGLPNPTWMRGKVRIQGSVLAGLIKVNASCNVEVGQICIPSVNPLEDIKLVTEVGPSGKDVSVFANPYITFSMPMDESVVDFQIPSTDLDKPKPVNKRYRFQVETVTLTDMDKTKDTVTFTPRYNNDKHILTLATTNGFNPNSKYAIYIKCSATEYNFATDKWENKNALIEDTTIYYYTGEAPDTIAENHVVFAYPWNGHKYLLKNEFSQGVIKIDKWIDEYFKGGTITNDYVVGFVDKGPRQYPKIQEENVVKSISQISGPQYDLTIPIIYADPGWQPFARNAGTREISFGIPSSLKNDRVYEITFVVKSQVVADGVLNTDDIDLTKKRENKTAATKKQSGKSIAAGVNNRFSLGANGGVFTANTARGGRGSSGTRSPGGNGSNPTIQNPDKVGGPTLIGGTVGGRNNALASSFTTQSNNIGNVVKIPTNVRTEVSKPSGGVTSDTFSLTGHNLNTYVPGKGERVIYKMTVTTSKYSTLSDKLNAFGTLKTTKGDAHTVQTKPNNKAAVTYSLFDIKSNDMSEPFDSYEVNGFEKTVGESNSAFKIKTPPLLNASMVYDISIQNDQSMDALYKQIDHLYVREFTVFLGNSKYRRMGGNTTKKNVPMLLRGIIQRGVAYNVPGQMTPNGPRPSQVIYDIKITDIDRHLILSNNRDEFYAYDYGLLQDASLYYLKNMGKSRNHGAGSRLNYSWKTISSNTKGGKILYTQSGGTKYEQLMTTINQLQYKQMTVSDPRKVQFEYGYRFEMYDSINDEYKTSNNGANENLGSQIPTSFKGEGKVKKSQKAIK